MFRRLKQRFADMRTMTSLCQGAERLANADGQQEAGAEHFILAALELPDGTARASFLRAGADPARFRDALAQQYADALESVGIAAGALARAGGAPPAPPRKGLYRAKASAQALLQELADWKKSSATEPLLGAHVVAVGAAAQHGVAARALRRMGVDLQALVTAARTEIAAANA